MRVSPREARVQEHTARGRARGGFSHVNASYKWLLVEAEKWLSTAEQGWFGALVTAVGSLKPPRVSVFQPETYAAGHLAIITGFENGRRVARDSYSHRYYLCYS